MVQCGYCGLKWKQFPVEQDNKTQSITRSQKPLKSYSSTKKTKIKKKLKN